MREEFIISARPRVGTHMLRSGMNHHPQIYAANEFLNVYMLLPYRQACHTMAEFRARIQYNNPGRFTGWSLHDDQYHYHMRRCMPVTSEEWEAIPTETRIIRLNRRNEFARLVSECRARLTNVWQRIERQIYENEDLPFHLDFDTMMQLYELNHIAFLAKEEYLKRFPNILHVWHEDLCDNWDGEMERVFDFLGKNNILTRPTTMRMGLPIPYMIDNYGEITERCQGTPLEQYFD